MHKLETAVTFEIHALAGGRFRAVAYNAHSEPVDQGKRWAIRAKAERDLEVMRSVAQALRLKAENRKVVTTGVCPTCGAPLRSNLSITGWYQCAQLGAVGFRADAAKAPCGWQAFV